MSEKAEPDLPQSPLRQDEPAIVLISKNLQNPGKEMQILGEEALEERLVKSPVFNRRFIVPKTSLWFMRDTLLQSSCLEREGLRMGHRSQCTDKSVDSFFLFYSQLWDWAGSLKGYECGKVLKLCYTPGQRWPHRAMLQFDCFRQYHWTLTYRAFLHNNFLIFKHWYHNDDYLKQKLDYSVLLLN